MRLTCFLSSHISLYRRLLIITPYFTCKDIYSTFLIVFNLPHTRASGIGCADLFSFPKMPNIVPSAIETSNSKVSSGNNAAVFPEW